MTAYPTLEELLNSPSRNELLVVRRSVYSLLYLVWILLASFLITLWFAYLSNNSIFYSRYLTFLKPSIIGVVPLIVLLEILRQIYNDVYIFGDSLLTHRRGRLSMSYNVPVVRYEDIRAVNVIQDFWGRIFSYGDILVGTSAQLGNEIVITGVKHPESLAILIDKLRSAAINK